MRRGRGEGEVQGGIKGVGRAGGLSKDRIGLGSCLPVLLVGHRSLEAHRLASLACLHRWCLATLDAPFIYISLYILCFNLSMYA